MAYKHLQTTVLPKIHEALIATRGSQGQVVYVSLARVLISNRETFPMPFVPKHAEGVWSTSSSQCDRERTQTPYVWDGVPTIFRTGFRHLYTDYLWSIYNHMEFLQTSDGHIPFHFNRLQLAHNFANQKNIVHSSASQTPFKRSLLMPKRRISAVNKTQWQ